MGWATFGWVALGGAVGAPARFLLDRAVTARTAAVRMPVGLLVVNVLGSALLGVVLAIGDPTLTLAAGTGLCGAFTTFSGFTWEANRLWREVEHRSWFWAWSAAMVAGCLGAFWLAWTATRAVTG